MVKKPLPKTFLNVGRKGDSVVLAVEFKPSAKRTRRPILIELQQATARRLLAQLERAIGTAYARPYGGGKTG